MGSPRRLAWTLAASLVLGMVFLAYLQPAFVADLASRIVLCF